MKQRRVFAVDIGASGGKMCAGAFDGKKLTVEGRRDFPNRPVDIGTALYWDVFSLYHAILDGMAAAIADGDRIDSIGIDTWGASYGLLDDKGRLLEPVYHYRDVRTLDIMRRMEMEMSAAELFALTGCQCNRTYTLPQLYASVLEGGGVLERAEKLLFLPDMLSYFLSGEAVTELTIAGTSCLMDKSLESFSREVLKSFRIPERMFTGLAAPGSVRGQVRESVFSGGGSIAVTAAIGHDTASAVAAIPGFGQNKLYLGIGTNVNMGMEAESCLLSKEACEKGLKNTSGFGGSKIRYRDFAGFWLLNEFLADAEKRGKKHTYESLMELAERTQPPEAVIDVDYGDFNNAGGSMAEKINVYLQKTGQQPLSEEGEFVRCILEGIALKAGLYGQAFEDLGFPYEEVFAVNGGSRNRVLMQYLSEALGKPVKAGLPYATLAGNLLTQLYALGELASVEDMRRLSAESFKMKTYEPAGAAGWQEKLSLLRELMNQDVM